MKRRIYSTALIAVFAALIAFNGFGVHAQSVEDQRRALALAKTQSDQAEVRAKQLEAKASEASDEVDRVRTRMAALAARIQATEADITTAEKRVNLIEKLRAEQRDRLAAKQEPVVRLLAALQMLSKRPMILSFVQPGSTNDLVHVRAVLETMIPQIRARTEGLRTEIARSQNLKATADRAISLLKDSEQKLEGQRTTLSTEAARYRTQYQKFTQGAMLEQDRAIAMGEKARDIVDLIDQLGLAAEVGSQLATLSGPLLRPAQPSDSNAVPINTADGRAQFSSYRLPVTGTLVRGLGEVSSAGVRARGLTIATRPGAQVIAPAGGRVIFAGTYRGYGKIIIIDHSSGWTTLVTTLSTLDVRIGDQVDQGTPLGKAGNDRPTITVELRKGANPVDITPLIG
jgi:murein hydrolase activator